MKIGIITWFKYENYGTALQAIALQKYLRTKGYEVDLINYNIEEKNRRKKFKNFFPRLVLKINKIKYKKAFSKKSDSFKKIIYNNCNITDEVTKEEDYVKLCNSYNIIIFGSDQIWNPNLYHPFYFGNFNEINTKLIAYAPSFGVNKVPDDEILNIKSALQRFSNIAVREQKGQEIIKKLINKNVQIVVDPTLLITKEEWKNIEEPIENITNGNYLLCYILSDNLAHWHAIKKFAKRKHLKLIVIPHDGLSYIQSKNVVRSCTVGNFLYLIKNAKYVVTDSFHGSIFSIIYEKDFVLFERHNPKEKTAQNSRLYNLLEITGLEKYLLKYGTNSIKEIPNTDYSKVNEKLSKIINESKEYLEKAIYG